jgi:quercetin dioxygenase-like cupin family protein
MHRTTLIAAAVLSFVGLSTARAQDPLKAEPSHFKVIFENEQVRVLRVNYGPHEKSAMHEHPGNVVIAVTDTHVKITLADGKTTEATKKAGESWWQDAAKHTTENMSDKPLEVIQVELKAKAKLKAKAAK